MAEIDDDAMLDAQAAEHPAEPDGRASLEVYRFRGDDVQNVSHI